jgi:hypothetical protein
VDPDEPGAAGGPRADERRDADAGDERSYIRNQFAAWASYMRADA